MSSLLVDPFNWYRLSFASLPGVCLDIINDGTAHTYGKLQMAPNGLFTGQHWQFLPAPNGSYCLRTMYTGTDMLLLSNETWPSLSRRLGPDPEQCYLEPVDSGSSRLEEIQVRIRVEVPGKSHGRFYLRPQPDATWFNGQRLRLVDRSLGSLLGSTVLERDDIWTLTTIKRIDLPEYMILPLISPVGTGGWTNVRTSYGTGSAGTVSMFIEDTDRVTKIIERLDPETCPLGWAYRFDNQDRLLYLDIHELQWHSASLLSRPSFGTSPVIAFQAIDQHGTRGLGHDLLSHALDSLNLASTLTVDVSIGFTEPKLLQGLSELTPTVPTEDHSNMSLSRGGRVYSTGNILVSTSTGIGGLTYVFCVREGTVMIKASSASQAMQEDRWICKIQEDIVDLLVPACSLIRVGSEDVVPHNFLWCDRGRDVEFKPGEQIPLHILDTLGHGGQAVVDKVSCRGRVLARKQIRTTRKVPLEVAMGELQSIQRVQSHRHIVNIVGSYTQGHTFGIIMHPVAECDLQTALENYSDREYEAQFFDGRASRKEFARWLWRYFGCLANGLAYMHHQSIRHRDIKPRNILVTLKGPLYTDFGIARDFSESTASTTAGPTMKTYEYCAPEVAHGAERGRSSDVFSLGCVFLELLTVLVDLCPYEDCRVRRQTDTDPSFHANMDKVASWRAELAEAISIQARTGNDNILHLLSQIKQMLEVDRTRRPSALDLWGYITDLTVEADDGQGEHRFCGRCCLYGSPV